MRNIFRRKNGQEHPSHRLRNLPLIVVDAALLTKHRVTRFDKIEALLDAVIDAVGVQKVLNNSAVMDYDKRYKEYEEEMKKNERKETSKE